MAEGVAWKPGWRLTHCDIIEMTDMQYLDGSEPSIMKMDLFFADYTKRATAKEFKRFVALMKDGDGEEQYRQIRELVQRCMAADRASPIGE